VTAGLTAAWEGRWSGIRPIGHELSYAQPGRWIRFHSLPESKRYADTEAECAGILARHTTVMRELTGGIDEVLVVTCSWSGDQRPVEREPELEATSGAAEHWRSVLTDDSLPDEPQWTHLFVQSMRLDDERLSRLLRLVADDGTAGVIVADRDWRWLYHPYDGGADVGSLADGRAVLLRCCTRSCGRAAPQER
jgi:hypothetical protein